MMMLWTRRGQRPRRTTPTSLVALWATGLGAQLQGARRLWSQPRAQRPFWDRPPPLALVRPSRKGGGFASDPVQPQDLEPSCLPHPLHPPQPILFILSSLPILLPSTSSSPYSSCSPSSDFPILPPCLSIFLVLSVLSTLPPILPERGQAEGHQPSLSPDSLSPDLQASSS